MAKLLVVHGLIMNGGVHYALESARREELTAAADGYDYFGCAEVAAFFRGAEQDPILSTWTEETEEPANRRYAELVPEDSYLIAQFERALRERPEDFAPLGRA